MLVEYKLYIINSIIRFGCAFVNRYNLHARGNRRYAKDFADGTTVTLGQNGLSSGCTNYTVFVTENIPTPTTEPTTEATEPTAEITEPTAAPTTEPTNEPIPVKGDIDRSGQCNLLDVIGNADYRVTVRKASFR